MWVCVYSSTCIRLGILHRGTQMVSLSGGKEAGLMHTVLQAGHRVNGTHCDTAARPEVTILGVRETSLRFTEQYNMCHDTKMHGFLSDMSRTSKRRYEWGAGHQTRLPREWDTSLESGKVLRRHLGNSKGRRGQGGGVAGAKTQKHHMRVQADCYEWRKEFQGVSSCYLIWGAFVWFLKVLKIL